MRLEHKEPVAADGLPLVDRVRRSVEDIEEMHGQMLARLGIREDAPGFVAGTTWILAGQLAGPFTGRAAPHMSPICYLREATEAARSMVDDGQPRERRLRAYGVLAALAWASGRPMVVPPPF